MHRPGKRNFVQSRPFLLIISLFVIAGIIIGYLVYAFYHAAILRVKLKCDDLVYADISGIREWEDSQYRRNWYLSRVKVDVTSDCEPNIIFKRTENILKKRWRNEKEEVDIESIDIAWIDNASESFAPINILDACPDSHGRSDGELCISDEDIHQHFPYLISYAKSNGVLDKRKVMGVPLWADVGLLFYNKNFIDDQSLPKTWSEMVEKINSVKRNRPDLSGFTWQGRAGQGLFCNFLEWVGTADNLISGSYDKNGRAIEYTVHGDMIVKAVKMAKSWIWRSRASPYSVLENDEIKSIREFSNGNIIFMRNWPRAWDELRNFTKSEPNDNFGVSLLPSINNEGRKRSGVLGGWLLGIRKNANNKIYALELIKHLTGKEHQLRRAREGAFLPTIKSAYDDLAKREDEDSFFRILNESIKTQVGDDKMTIADLFGHDRNYITYAIERPSADLGACYERFSEDLASVVHKGLAFEDNKYIQSELKGIRERLAKCKGIRVYM